MENIPLLPGLGLFGTGWLLVGYIVWLYNRRIADGDLVPRREIDNVRADRDVRLGEVRAEKDEWRDAYYKSEQAREKQSDQLDTLLEVARTSEAILKALPGGERS